MNRSTGVRVRRTDGDPVLAAQIAARYDDDPSGPLEVVVGRWSGPSGPDPILVVGPDDADHMIRCLEAGAIGYVVDDQPLDAIFAAGRSVREGRAVVPDHLLGDLLRHVVDRRRRTSEAEGALDELSARERQVFSVAARGADKNQIGAVLGISPETARTHIANIFGKLGIGSRAELIALAASLGNDTSPLENSELS